MANWIESQLCVTGPKESLENFKNSFISYDENLYYFDFDRLFAGYEYVLSREFLDINHSGITFSNVLVLEDHSPNFKMKYKSSNNYYEYVERFRFNYYTWIDPAYHSRDTASIVENQIILQFTSHWSPPIGAIIQTSKQYPDLKFRLAFYDISESFHPDCCGCVEGQNGVFKDSNHDYGYYHAESKRPLIHFDIGSWLYTDTLEYIEDSTFTPELRGSNYYDKTNNRIVLSCGDGCWVYEDSFEFIEELGYIPEVTNTLFYDVVSKSATNKNVNTEFELGE